MASLAALAALATLLANLAAARGVRPVARAAHTVTGTATARLSLERAQGKTLFEHGPVSGAFQGSARAELHVGAAFKASFTISTHSGSISGRGEATPHGSGRYQSFSGSFTITGGKGRYAHIRGHGGLYGVMDRRTDNVTVQTTGRLSY